LTRQDVARWCKRLGVPFEPPTITTDPTPAALLACAAESAGVLPAYVKAVMWREWAEGADIGQRDVLAAVARDVGLGDGEVDAALESAPYRQRLADNRGLAAELGVIGVPTFVVGDQIFWGNDRLDFLEEHLAELGLGKLGSE
jgi:2-hydroxychromene-2-carboxylate isomerase